MILGDLTGPAAYAVILIASAVEGEVVYVAASVLVGRRLLPPAPVILAGAIGAAAGDQFYYFAARGWLRRWLRKRMTGVARAEAILARVKTYGALMAFAIRFLPGARIAIAMGCAAAGVSPMRFAVANLVGALVWAVSVMGIVAWGGPALLAAIGLPAWTGWIIPALVVLAVVRLIARTED